METNLGEGLAPHPPRRPARQATLWLLVLLVAGAMAGCDDNPTDPNATPQIFEGVVTYQGQSEHEYQVAKQGTIRIQVEDLRALLVDVTFNPDFVPFVGVAIGRLTSEGCNATARFSSREGDLLLFQLAPGNYCLQVSDPGALPVDGTIAYELSLRLPS